MKGGLGNSRQVEIEWKLEVGGRREGMGGRYRGGGVDETRGKEEGKARREMVGGCCQREIEGEGRSMEGEGAGRERS